MVCPFSGSACQNSEDNTKLGMRFLLLLNLVLPDSTTVSFAEKIGKDELTIRKVAVFTFIVLVKKRLSLHYKLHFETLRNWLTKYFDGNPERWGSQ